jgi:hypothetical protein
MKIEKIEIDLRLTVKLVEELARQTRRPLTEARQAYESQFQRLDGQARVKRYLPVLAARHAKKVLSRPR